MSVALRPGSHRACGLHTCYCATMLQWQIAQDTHIICEVLHGRIACNKTLKGACKAFWAHAKCQKKVPASTYHRVHRLSAGTSVQTSPDTAAEAVSALGVEGAPGWAFVALSRAVCCAFPASSVRWPAHGGLPRQLLGWRGHLPQAQHHQPLRPQQAVPASRGAPQACPCALYVH